MDDQVAALKEGSLRDGAAWHRTRGVNDERELFAGRAILAACLPRSINLGTTSAFRHDLPRDVLAEEREHLGLVKLGRPAVGCVVVPGH